MNTSTKNFQFKAWKGSCFKISIEIVIVIKLTINDEEVVLGNPSDRDNLALDLFKDPELTIKDKEVVLGSPSDRDDLALDLFVDVIGNLVDITVEAVEAAGEDPYDWLNETDSQPKIEYVDIEDGVFGDDDDDVPIVDDDDRVNDFYGTILIRTIFYGQF